LADTAQQNSAHQFTRWEVIVSRRIVAAALVFGPTLFWWESAGGDVPWLIGGAIGFYILNVISTFFGVAFIAVARRSIAGESWTLSDGWSAARSRLGPILWWAVVATVVGLLLQALERVRGILVEQLGVDEEQVTEDASFQGDLDADSLDLVELIMELEDQFGLKISDEDAQQISTVGQAVDYVVSHS